MLMMVMVNLKKLLNGVLHLCLHKPELFIAFIPEDSPKDAHIVIGLRELLNAIDNRSRPLNDQTLKPVLLIQIGVHVLLHRLPRKLGVMVLLIVLSFCRVQFLYHVLQLVEGKRTQSCLADRFAEPASGLLPLLWLEDVAIVLW